jgi:putative CocE/NonD family hydrolase
MRPLVLILAATLLAAPAAGQIRSEFGLMVPMRDGVRLAADLWGPEAPGQYPVLLVRTPYLKTGLQLAEWGRYFAERGYVFVVQDTRGRGDSEGTFEFFAGDGRDGHDAIEWLAARPWSNGRVGTLGLSYLGTVQWLAAKERPPHLACMAPTAPGGRWFDEIPYLGGAFALAWALNWVNGNSGRMPQGENAAHIDWQRVLAHRPLLTADSVLGRIMPLYRSWLEHPVKGPFWSRMEYRPEDFATIEIPTLTVTGWFDADQPGSLHYWRGLMARAPDRNRHFLMIGPWDHVQTFQGGATQIGEMTFSPESVIDTKKLHLDFFDWCLKKTSPSFEAPRARIYLTGADTWRTFDAYPPPEATPTRLFLTSGGRANGLSGDGRLSWQPVDDSPPDRFRYDPKNPVPGSMNELAIDRRPRQDRPDVLVYTGEVLTEPVEIVGTVTVDLQAATDARDTDFVAVLTDVYPDGRAVQLGARVGIRRARYRNGYEREELLTPGRVERYTIELNDIAHQFKAGHRIRLEITSSSAPYYNPNQNTGNPVATDTEWKVANQTIHHERARPSAVTLPVLSRRPVP